MCPLVSYANQLVFFVARSCVIAGTQWDDLAVFVLLFKKITTFFKRSCVRNKWRYLAVGRFTLVLRLTQFHQ